MFLKLKDLTSTASFQVRNELFLVDIFNTNRRFNYLFIFNLFYNLQEIDVNNNGWVDPKDFKEKMEQQKSYTP